MTEKTLFSLKDAQNQVMKIIPFPQIIENIIQNYSDDENGAFCFQGNLNLRPAYQRELCYNLEQMQAVIFSILNNHPINAMYFAENPDDPQYFSTRYNCFDGQQRIISICRFARGDFSIPCDDGRMYYITNLKRVYPELYNRFMKYELNIYLTYGDLSHQIAWFKRINTYGERLTDQEIRNVSYTGPWLNDLKRYFSKPNCAGYTLLKNYVLGKVERQDYLKEILEWISCGEIDAYMQEHRYDSDAKNEWNYVNNVIEWVKTIFPDRYYREEMRGIAWGILYNTYHDTQYDAEILEKEVKKYMCDDEIKTKKGIYKYLLTQNPKFLNLRTFDKSQKRTMYERQNGICPMCGQKFSITQMHADHIKPWSHGGKTELSNGQMLCASCNLKKGDSIIYYEEE